MKNTLTSYIKILSYVSIVFLSGCAPSTLVISKAKTLTLTQERSTTTLANKVLDKQYDFYQHVEIDKYKLKNADETLFFEHVYVESDWEFSYGPILILKYIFDASDADILYKDSSLCLMQLKIGKDVYINIIMESSYSDEMTYAYGFSNEVFRGLSKKLTSKDILLKYEGKTLDSSEKHMSRWSVLMLLLEPLVQLELRTISDK